MKQVDFNVPFLSLKGEEIKDSKGDCVLLSEAIADALSKKSDPIKARKAVGWAKAVVAGDKLLLDDQDLKDLSTFIENHDDFTNAYKIQLLDAIEK